jgi:DNA-binding PadR family transcriptional regulator
VNLLARYQMNRRKRRECTVLGALALHPGGAYAIDIAATCGRPPGTLYPELAALEKAGSIVSWWDDSTIPRRRRYRLRIVRDLAVSLRDAMDARGLPS